MESNKIKDVLYWLELAVELAQKEESRLHQAGRDNLALDLDLKKTTRAEINNYLSISTEERMEINGVLMNQEIKVGFAITKLKDIIYYEKLRKGEL